MAFGRPTLTEAARFSWSYLVIAAAIAVTAWVVSKLSMLFLTVFVALLLTSLLNPISRRLRRRGWKPSLAAFVAVFGAVAIFGGVIGWIVPTTVSEIRRNGPNLVNQAQQTFQRVAERLPAQAPDASELASRLSTALTQNAERIAKGVAAGLSSATMILGGLLLAIVLTFFFVRDGKTMAGKTFGLMKIEHRHVVEPAIERGWRTLSGWLRGASLIALIDAVGIGAGLVIVGVPLALPLAILTFFGAFIPVVGATVTGALAVFVALITGGLTDALIILAVVLAVQQLEGNVLEPMVMGHYLPLHPAVILLAVTAGALVAGIPGAFVAVPLLASATAGVKELRSRVPRDDWQADLRAAGEQEHAPPSH